MSEAVRAHTQQAWLAHSSETAHWMVQLLGWLWLGQQGMRQGWSLASGVLPVALWWALRVLCRGTRWAFWCPSAWLGFCGVVTALGVWLFDRSSVQAVTPWALLALAAVWGVWSALIETRDQGSGLHGGRVAWVPLLVAGALGSALSLKAAAGVSSGGMGLLLGLCAAVLHARDRLPGMRAHACKAVSGTLSNLPAPAAMGLMMGTLWLGGDWCMGASWTQEQAVAAHVLLMAGLPVLVALLLQVLKLQAGIQLSPAAHDVFTLGFMTLSGGLWLGGSAAHGALSMATAAFAWALHCSRPRSAVAQQAQLSHGARRLLTLLLGPVLLVWVGMASAQQGPSAMRSAFALLAALCGCLLLRVLLQACHQHVQPPATPVRTPGTAITRNPIA